MKCKLYLTPVSQSGIKGTEIDKRKAAASAELATGPVHPTTSDSEYRHAKYINETCGCLLSDIERDQRRQDKDSLGRQERAVREFAARNDIEIVDEYYDAAVSGADPIPSRDGFSRMLQRIMSNGVRTILVETANRFARDLMVQETGWRMLQDLGVELIAVDSPGAFVEDTPTAILIRKSSARSPNLTRP